LKNLISFYDKFDIVYGKSKHGLAYITGGSADPINKGKRIFDNSVLSCYSRINKKHTMPKETIASSTFSSSPPMQYRYFNFISIINFSTNLVEEINSILSRLNELISFVCKNHELYALNCGKVYLPCNKRENKLIMMNLRKPQLYTENDQKILKNIAEKNLPKIYFPSLETIFNIRYTNPKVIQSITDNSITNILIP
jgi:hypothetical protein